MSHIDVAPHALEVQSQAEFSSSESRVTEQNSGGSFGRGLACGLVLAVSFWTFVAIVFVSR